MKKKIAFIHFHLKTGGVTTVLKQQVEAIMDQCEVLVLSGEPVCSSFPVPTLHIPGLGYYDGLENDKVYDPEHVAESVIEAINFKFNGKCDVLHVHNPLIAKNVIFIEILKRLKKEGINLFLQVHDFAEDGRPQVYFSDTEYISNCHYGVINSRDYEIMLKAGLKKEGLHLVSNPVNAFNVKKQKDNDKPIALYPVRAIRRKNIGEAILLSLFFKHNETLCITLPPQSAHDVESYMGWQTFVKINHLTVEFEAGLKNDFETLMLSARFLITTSISEGFGFSFVEPWMAGKMLWGRKLKHVCKDFEKNGIRFDHLYTKLHVPVDWIGKQDLFIRWQTAVLKSCEKYTFKIHNNDIMSAFEKITADDLIDFGLLDEFFQKQVITMVLSSKENKNRLIALNPEMSIPKDIFDQDQLVESNMNDLEKKYNKTSYKNKLMDIYSKVAGHRLHHKIDKKILLSQFFCLEDFSLLQWADYVEWLP